jgi:LuxR family transcriptional regulator, maltose regulon positive regulatory protein
MLATMIPIGDSGIVVVMAITQQGVVVTFPATNTRTVPLDPCVKVTGVSEKSAGDPVRVVAGGVVVRSELFERLNRAGRVTEVSGPAGSGKSFLLRSWIDETGLADHAAQVSVQDSDRDPQRFWTSVADALRDTAPGSALVRPVTALDGWAVVEQLLADLGSLRDRIWLVIDDVHALDSAETLRQLELLLTRAPAGLRFVLATRHNLRLGLHRLRLEGELTEIRAASLRFSRDEARALFEAAGARLPESALALLHERTEGWAAGLRLASLSLTGHPDPERFAAEFCGNERTVAEYMLVEVLERQSEEARRLLSRTCVLERVSGPLADLLTGGSGGGRILQELEQAGAFVVALDAQRSWFRYHRLFADLLERDLRHTEPAELAALHGTAASWFAEHGFGADAIRHAQAAQDWERAGRLLTDHWLELTLAGQAATVHQLVSSFPTDAVTASAELTAVAAAAELMCGSLEEGARYLALAAAGAASVPASRSESFRVTLAVLRLYLARQRGDLRAVAEEVEQLRSAGALDVAQPGLGQELRALALISLGIGELWSLRLHEAETHLERGVALARRIGRPLLEIIGLAHWGLVASFRSPARGVQRGMQAIELAQRHGWGGEPLVAIVYPMLASSLIWQGELEEAERWLMEGEYALQPEVEPTTAMLFHLVRGFLEIARGRPGVALAAVTAPRLAQDNPPAATAAVAPVLDSSTPESHQVWVIAALLLEASARDALGDREAAGRALERGLDLAEPDGLLFPFLLHPVPELLERQARQHTAHPALIRKIISMLGGRTPAPPPAGLPAPPPAGPPAAPAVGLPAPPPAGPPAAPAVGLPAPPAAARPERLPEPLSQAEARVLRFLQTSLSAPEIARELYVSVNTVRTHMRHLYDKLGAHRRLEALDRARALGLLTPVPQRALPGRPTSRVLVDAMVADPAPDQQGLTVVHLVQMKGRAPVRGREVPGQRIDLSVAQLVDPHPLGPSRSAAERPGTDCREEELPQHLQEHLLMLGREPPEVVPEGLKRAVLQRSGSAASDSRSARKLSASSKVRKRPPARSSSASRSAAWCPSDQNHRSSTGTGRVGRSSITPSSRSVTSS